ncbi:MAG: sigma-54-dependent Fis family transcriptional regulator [Calditrichaeota bacterium]|nr:sigma-54-dependent Fis family transcriptional regulator [Calditrichota bacterium]
MNDKPTILLIDDEERIRTVLSDILRLKGYETLTAESGKQGLKIFKEQHIDCLLLDLILPEENGLDILKQIRQTASNVPVIMITAFGSIPIAVEAIKQGAYDFVEKPLDVDRILVVIKNALEKFQLTQENIRLRKNILDRYRMVGKSAAMLQVFEQIDALAPQECNVLITGETGTGKDLIARCFHNLSPRISQPFVKVNCAAIPSELLESELFGYHKGAFTGAVQTKIGLFESANFGTLFLDEIGELPRPLQAKMLQVLEEKTFFRLGETVQRKIDVRVIAATNKDLKEEVEQHRFREDLFYRLNTAVIHLPPLRERREDIPELIDFFLPLLCDELKIEHKALTPEAIHLLIQHDWQGNVRELKQKLLQMLIFSQGKELDAVYVREWLDNNKNVETLSTTLRIARENFERDYIHQALLAHHWNIPATANYLGIERTNLYRKIKQLGITQS